MRAAIYARYSTDNQREVSIADQIRECEKLAERHGFDVMTSYSDRGVSGGTANRPGYQSLMLGAREKAFEVIIADDLSRLWRSMVEQAPRLAELQDLGIHVVTHDFDSRQESSDLLGAVSGAMNALYRKEISRRTRRGLVGNALAGKPTGGRCYGYEKGVIEPNEAAIVLQVFEWRAKGRTLREIAALLNQGAPAARGGKWTFSTVAAMLKNIRYTGAVVWGAKEVKRSAVDSSKKRKVKRPVPVIDRFDETLRIVPDKLWHSVQSTGD